jgi:hypothetical protein
MDPISLTVAALGAALPLVNELLKRVIGDSTEHPSVTAPTDRSSNTPEGVSPFSLNKSKVMRELKQVYNDAILYVNNPHDKRNYLLVLEGARQEINAAQTDDTLENAEFSISKVATEIRRYRNNLGEQSKARTAGIITSLLAIFVLAGFIFYSPQFGVDSKTLISLLDIPAYVVLWAAIGSYTAILYRFNHQAEWEILSPTRWLYTRPVTGVVMGTITYLMVEVGVLAFTNGSARVATAATVSVQGVSLPSTSATLLALVAFLAGFSDKFADALLMTLIGRLGGDEKGGIMSGEVQTPAHVHSTEQPSFAVMAPGKPEGQVKRLQRARAGGENGKSGNTRTTNRRAAQVTVVPGTETNGGAAANWPSGVESTGTEQPDEPEAQSRNPEPSNPSRASEPDQ